MLAALAFRNVQGQGRRRSPLCFFPATIAIFEIKIVKIIIIINIIKKTVLVLL